MLFKTLVILVQLLVFSAVAKADSLGNTKVISVGKDIYNTTLANKFWSNIKYYSDDIVILEVPEDKLSQISLVAHRKFNRCGGFVLESTIDEALNNLLTINSKQYDQNIINYSIDNEELVKSKMRLVSESRLYNHIQTMSSFRNRYYKTSQGVASQNWVYDQWKEIAGERSDISVAYFNHSRYPQPSVIATVRGTDFPDEYIIIGGHGDSIAGWFPSENTLAPGADDNSSGIAVLTEVFRVLTSKNFRPQRSIQFISYAAEEVGLRGSNEIANQYKEQQKDIKGVMQLDMTNFHGNEFDIVLIGDYTSSPQNEFVKELITFYLPEIKWTQDQCGYACSDHVSWYRAGYPVSFPFESNFATYNKKIHTADDTLETMNQSTKHSIPFAKLALAYAIEMLIVGNY